jgi:carbamate kinase
MFYTKEEADRIAAEKGFQFVEDAGRGYRRVVPSPKPIDIIEKETIKELVQKNNIVICAGGGGVPVIRDEDNNLVGVAAVIDKDRSGALLARLIDADILLILTAVDKVAIHFNTPDQIELSEMTLEEAEKYMSDGEFAKGSMLPKVEACIDFVKSDISKYAIIGSLENARAAVNGENGTIIKNKKEEK